MKVIRTVLDPHTNLPQLSDVLPGTLVTVVGTTWAHNSRSTPMIVMAACKYQKLGEPMPEDDFAKASTSRWSSNDDARLLDPATGIVWTTSAFLRCIVHESAEVRYDEEPIDE